MKIIGIGNGDNVIVLLNKADVEMLAQDCRAPLVGSEHSLEWIQDMQHKLSRCNSILLSVQAWLKDIEK
jgi:hypothetical protein